MYESNCHITLFQFTPVSLASANLVDPNISLTPTTDLEFLLTANGGVGVFTWLDHPSGTVGSFVDANSGVPSNGYFLIPNQDRKGIIAYCILFCGAVLNFFSEIYTQHGFVSKHFARYKLIYFAFRVE
jgi:hypothetical protein